MIYPRRTAQASNRAQNPLSTKLWNPLNSSSRVFGPQLAQRRPNEGAEAKQAPPPLQAQQTPALPNPTDSQPGPSVVQQRQSSRRQTINSLQVEASNVDDGNSSNRESTGERLRIHPISRKGKEPAHRTKMSPRDAPPLSSNALFSNSPAPSNEPAQNSDNQDFVPSYAQDLESGARNQQSSSSTGTGSSYSSDLEWGPSHPCFPHPNPHVPLVSPLYNSTRIIRVQRDWMIAGDLAPTFSNVYPTILEAWVPEQDFRTLVETVNDGLISAFRPAGWRAWLDAVLGVATGWLWEDLGATAVKRQVRELEKFMDGWNVGRAKGRDEDVKVFPLRRTGFLSVSCSPCLK